jgi:cell pole-organizing protein PopZ
MLRPMLAEWLETHLPAIVDRMVQAEIARIAGKKG